MTHDKQDPDTDAPAGSPDTERPPAGLVYLVRDRPRAEGGESDGDHLDEDFTDHPTAGYDNDVASEGDDGAGGEDAPDRHSDRQGGRTAAGEDWPWVVEWRAGREPTPWATGLALTVFSALVVGVAVWVLSAGLVDRPIVAVLVNVLVAGGLAPAMWLSKDLPVLRWIAAGTLVGIVGGWVAALMMLPMPTV
ncbi:DUF2537 domain-containing protein [Nakamurella sp. GG22]